MGEEEVFAASEIVSCKCAKQLRRGHDGQVGTDLAGVAPHGVGGGVAVLCNLFWQ